jgi:elongation factor P--beta-lysine ligase
MNYEKLIKKLVDKKAEQDNQIDLNAYENGMRALAQALSIANVVGRSEQLVCSCNNPNGFKEMEEGKETCSQCQKPY